MKDQNTILALALVLVGAAGIWLIPPLAALYWTASASSNAEQWLGFIGNLVGAAATLLAAGIALYAAYRTIAPVKRQLAELMKQNDHIAYDKLRKRAADLNEELILLQRVTAEARLMDMQVAEFTTGSDPRNSFGRAEMALDRYAESVRLLQAVRGSVWGDKETQESRDGFIDASLRCGSAGSSFLTKTRSLHQSVLITAKPAITAWCERFRELEENAQPVYERIMAETKRVRIAIGALERQIFE